MYRLTFFLFAALCLLAACSKYKNLQDATYPEQTVYMPTAVQGNANNGLYEIRSVSAPGVVYRYTIDMAARKLNIPLGVYRAGIDTKGAVSVGVAANPDTVNRLIALNRIANGQLLQADKFSLPSTITIPDGASSASVLLSVDLDYLLANAGKSQAIGVGIGSADRKVNPALGLTVVVIDPAFLTPVANFTATVNAATRTVTFANTSTNAASFKWEFGDNTTSTATAAPKTYEAPGTYTVTLTAFGALGEGNKSVKTATVVIP